MKDIDRFQCIRCNCEFAASGTDKPPKKCPRCDRADTVIPLVPSAALPAMEKQVGGKHYKGFAIQPAEYVYKNGIGYLEGNVIKYISRHKEKGGAEDVRKALHYCEMILEMHYNQTPR